ncbi:hypothetical protein GYMLUDRAFT_73335 [Collybiopsis luxurians FD-317 M1]|uniref:Uncharacterized protein n=1 Tax=Collybiopsis luxurians FD-317 M1 TaxID=944289 RepID=A0A0D0CQJ4_9AGAR|nr:hypothetical protein GYMLUDRAFT_73335 [Collybiopsis luxurians FD-317 M1]
MRGSRLRNIATVSNIELRFKSRAIQAGKLYGAANVEVLETNKEEPTDSHKVFFVDSSDKDLRCGIHSSSTKTTRRAFANASNSSIPQSPVVGDKSNFQLSRVYDGNLTKSNDVPTFVDAAGRVDLAMKSSVTFDSVVITYNNYNEYKTDDDFAKDLFESPPTNTLFAAFIESHACEQSARRNAYNRGRWAAIANELVDTVIGLNALRHF